MTTLHGSAFENPTTTTSVAYLVCRKNPEDVSITLPPRPKGAQTQDTRLARMNPVTAGRCSAGSSSKGINRPYIRCLRNQKRAVSMGLQMPSTGQGLVLLNTASPPAATHLSYRRLLTAQSRSRLPTHTAQHLVRQLQLREAWWNDSLLGCHASTSTPKLQAQWHKLRSSWIQHGCQHHAVDIGGKNRHHLLVLR